MAGFVALMRLSLGVGSLYLNALLWTSGPTHLAVGCSHLIHAAFALTQKTEKKNSIYRYSKLPDSHQTTPTALLLAPPGATPTRQTPPSPDRRRLAPRLPRLGECAPPRPEPGRSGTAPAGTYGAGQLDSSSWCSVRSVRSLLVRPGAPFVANLVTSSDARSP